MVAGSAWHPAVLLAALFVAGTTSVTASPDNTHVGVMWPVGFAGAALVTSSRLLAPYVQIAITAVTASAFAIGGYPLAVAGGYGLAIAAEATVAHRVLTRPWRPPVRAVGERDLARFAVACGAAGLTGCVLFAAVSALTSFGTPWKVGVVVLVTHAIGYAMLLGLFAEREPDVHDFTMRQRVVAWALTVLVTCGAFMTGDAPALTFLVIPLLAWVAFRAQPVEAFAQLLLVGALAGTFTIQGKGPFADSDLVRRLDPEFVYLPLQAFLLACLMVTVPLAMSVARQRRSESAVHLEQARSARLIESARGIAIIGTDAEGRITLFNTGAERILGYSAAEVMGRSTRMFHTADEMVRLARELGTTPAYRTVLAALRDLPPDVSCDLEFVRKDGEPRMLATIVSPVRDDRGQLAGYVATADDVTERVTAQRALEAALGSEREAVDRLVEVDRMKDTLVSSVSHELRTPITNIVGYLELLMEGIYGTPTAEQTRALARIDVNSKRLLALIDNLLTLSHLDSIEQNVVRAPVELGGVINRAVEIVRPSLRHRDLELELDLPTHPAIVSGDAGQLERMVINLATNAVKFTLDGGRVTLRLLPATDCRGAVIEVDDTGIGIAETDQPMLFSRFYRAAQAHEAAVPGSGLGLSIAKSIAELHGARISATSRVGVGSTFRVEFPQGEDLAS